MFGLETLSGSAEAAATVGVVFVEALALYVGYGAITGAVGSAVVRAVGGE
ncbi:DUF7512 family protein [Candidatus Halobonum tyrrellensis]|uniref:Uncharacterized protein n=1 Tax=Candidatus Halobonum tyrrellensis G22 TaxID=1324957 RepID=V4HH94_9EURY|nr:hypothetical protein [Candidatus Halobonum tyrrellensis]ESP90125.1 hypothetical protein K933_01152 [Candidatus Halobonum tyrrellensis G22]